MRRSNARLLMRASQRACPFIDHSQHPNSSFLQVGNTLPRPLGADSVGILLRNLDVLVSWELPADEHGPGLEDEAPPQSYLARMGHMRARTGPGEVGRKRRRAENAVANGRGGVGALRAIMGSRRDTLDFRWKATASRGMVWVRMTAFGVRLKALMKKGRWRPSIEGFWTSLRSPPAIAMQRMMGFVVSEDSEYFLHCLLCGTRKLLVWVRDAFF
jgi:hypothetical protein